MLLPVNNFFPFIFIILKFSSEKFVAFFRPNSWDKIFKWDMLFFIMETKTIKEIKKKIIKILKKNNVVRAGIFGSYATG